MTELTYQTFEQAIQDKTPTLVDFWAGWCMPCKIFAPVLEELSDELDGSINFAKLNIDAYQDIAVRYGIESIPTVILFQEGKPLERLVGVQPKQTVTAILKKHL